MAEKTVSIFGSGRVGPDRPEFAAAEQVGRALAEAGFTIANGGYKGTMLAAAQGARAAGGAVIGVTCLAFAGSIVNDFVTREVVTRSLDERLSTLIRLGDAYVVLPGGTGTLLELAMVWELKNKRFLDRTKPIVLMGEFWKPVVELVALDGPKSAACVAFARAPHEVVELIGSAL
jgi:uncharacterized protein (TIGR00730 family)